MPLQCSRDSCEAEEREYTSSSSTSDLNTFSMGAHSEMCDLQQAGSCAFRALISVQGLHVFYKLYINASRCVCMCVNMCVCVHKCVHVCVCASTKALNNYKTKGKSASYYQVEGCKRFKAKRSIKDIEGWESGGGGGG